MAVKSPSLACIESLGSFADEGAITNVGEYFNIPNVFHSVYSQ